MKERPKNNSKAAEFGLVILIVAISFLLWDTLFVFPIKLFVVFMHEASHALAILISGGSISEISIGFDLGGKIIATGGNDILIASSGYLGSLFFGLLLYYGSELKNIRKYIYFSVAAVLLLILVISLPTLEFITIGLITIAILIVSGLFSKILLVKLIVKSLALVSAIYVLIDLKEDMLSSEFASDASILAGALGVDQIVVSLIWLIISIILIAVTLKYSPSSSKKI
ncbi:MAG: M50 family metallopeptidase [Melioribacteraceae bacterium]